MFILLLVLLVALLLLTLFAPPATSSEAFGACDGGYTRCMASSGRGWCADRPGSGACVPGALDGPFDPDARCANWWYAGRCQWGPLCRRVDAVVPASRERNDPYHHPAPYNYRSGGWCE